ncbi:MAG: penicillin acylase family protein [Bryobacteraceae bacterium]
MNRIFKYINYLVAAVVLTVAAMGAWFVYRALPDTAGSMQAPVSAASRIDRDRYGVVHIRASSEDDVFFLQGYATAQDRLFQMDLGRRLAAGDVAEVAGKNGLESDLEARRLRIRALAAYYARVLDPKDHAPLAAYARGVNHFIESHRGRLPVEFHILRYDPAPWTVADSLLAGLQMYRALTSDWRREMSRGAFFHAADPAKARYLFPDPLLAGVPVAAGTPGSNAFAVSGAFSASGKPLLGSDPHLAPSLPPVWHQVHLQGGGLDVAGVALTGMPGVAIGHNRQIAWGITSLQFDEQDLFANPGPVRGTQRETVRVRGMANVDLAIPVTAKGPVFAGEDGRLWALRWSGAEHARFAYPFPELNKAHNWDEFRAALARHPGPGLHVVYADAAGNIGSQVVGRLPIRSAAGDWTGVIPYEDLPSQLNPPGGLVVAANANPFPAGYPYPVAGRFADPYRSQQIHARLNGRKRLTPAALQAIQRDIYSTPMHAVARMVAASPQARSSAGPAVAVLESWNGQMEPGLAAPYLASLTAERMRRAVAEAVAPGKGERFAELIPMSAVLRLFEQRPPGWFAGGYDAVLGQALGEAMAEGSQQQGSNVSAWRWGKVHRVAVRLPVLGELWWIGSWFWLGPAEEGGGPNTVRQVSARVWPSMRFATDTGDWEQTILTMPGGESGLAFSRHAKDQWGTWMAGEGLRFGFDRVEAEKSLRVEPLK